MNDRQRKRLMIRSGLVGFLLGIFWMVGVGAIWNRIHQPPPQVDIEVQPTIYEAADFDYWAARAGSPDDYVDRIMGLWAVGMKGRDPRHQQQANDILSAALANDSAQVVETACWGLAAMGPAAGDQLTAATHTVKRAGDKITQQDPGAWENVIVAASVAALSIAGDKAEKN